MYRANGKTIITIGRAYGSRGEEIGKKVAAELGIPFYDRELLAIEERECGGELFIDDLVVFDEKKTGYFYYMYALNPYRSGADKPSLDIVAEIVQEKAIKNVADQCSCVIVGRRADKILRDSYDVLSVFVSALLEKRIGWVSEREGVSEKDSKFIIKKTDRSRSAFYNAHGEGEWGCADNYNMCIDSGDLGIDNSAAMILQYLELSGKIYKT